MSCSGMSCSGMSCSGMSCSGMSCSGMSCSGMSCSGMSSLEESWTSLVSSITSSMPSVVRSVLPDSDSEHPRVAINTNIGSVIAPGPRDCRRRCTRFIRTDQHSCYPITLSGDSILARPFTCFNRCRRPPMALALVDPTQQLTERFVAEDLFGVLFRGLYCGAGSRSRPTHLPV